MQGARLRAAGDGTLDQEHRYYYSAGWQLIEELIDEDWVETGTATLDRQVQYVWGARYIDDIILRREIPGPDSLDSYEHIWYHLTDHQFSTVALIDNRATLVERVTYNAYGLARHHWAGDVTGDGAVNVDDRQAMNAAYGERIIDPDYNVDADVTRTGVVTSSDLQFTSTANYKAALVPGRLSAPGVGNTIGYAGYVFNAEVPSIEGAGGLYTVRYRHYDRSLARWLERDPLGYVDGMNLYEYVQSSSVNAMDPFGLIKDWLYDKWTWLTGQQDAEWEEMMQENIDLSKKKVDEAVESGDMHEVQAVQIVGRMEGNLANAMAILWHYRKKAYALIAIELVAVVPIVRLGLLSIEERALPILLQGLPI